MGAPVTPERIMRDRLAGDSEIMLRARVGFRQGLPIDSQLPQPIIAEAA